MRIAGYNPPMSHAGPKRPERKTKPFAQAVPSAPPSLKVRKQQVVRAAHKPLDGPYNHVRWAASTLRDQIRVTSQKSGVWGFASGRSPLAIPHLPPNYGEDTNKISKRYKSLKYIPS